MNKIKEKTAVIRILGLMILVGAGIFAGCSTKAEVNPPEKKPNNSAQPKETAKTEKTPEPSDPRTAAPPEKPDTQDINVSEKTSKMMLTSAVFEKIQTGMTLEEVEKIVGEKGMIVSDMNINGKKSKIYKWANDDFSVYIDVVVDENGKVIEKKNKGLN